MTFLAILLLVWLLFCAGPIGFLIGIVLLVLLFGGIEGFLVLLGICALVIIIWWLYASYQERKAGITEQKKKE